VLKKLERVQGVRGHIFIFDNLGPDESCTVMARPLRIQPPGGRYHVTVRGHERRAIFLDGRNRRHFRELLTERLERFESAAAPTKTSGTGALSGGVGDTAAGEGHMAGSTHFFARPHLALACHGQVKEIGAVMADVLNNYGLVFTYSFLGHLIRYLGLAGLAYLLFYVLWRRRALARKIQQAFPARSDLRRDLVLSLLSLAVFAGVGVLTVILHRAGWLQLYFDIGRYGWGYLGLSVAALVLIQDAWFYWTHRLMHHRHLFPLVHRVHHLSHNPTPWSAFAFHPAEALVQAIIFPIAALLIPLHPLAALLWLFYMTLLNVLGHLGFEILPRGFVRHRWTCWHNTSVHHNMHHRHVQCNFGLYFNLWDRWMGTNHPRYEEEYERVTTPHLPPATTPSPNPPCFRNLPN
jgi:Delta7-sterol 5-desaturase